MEPFLVEQTKCGSAECGSVVQYLVFFFHSSENLLPRLLAASSYQSSRPRSHFMKPPSHSQRSDVFRRLFPLEATNFTACDWNHSLFMDLLCIKKCINKLITDHPESNIWFAVYAKPGMHKKRPADFKLYSDRNLQINDKMNKKPRELAKEIGVSRKRCNEGVNKWLKPPRGPPKLTKLEGLLVMMLLFLVDGPYLIWSKK